MKKGIVALIGLIIIVLYSSIFILPEGAQAIVKRFGKIVDTKTEAGLKFKVPFTDEVKFLPKKVLSWDGDAQRIPTKENQFIWVDTTARWRIDNLKKFAEAVRGNINEAQARLDNIIESSVRTVITKNYLREAIRNSNIINEIKRENVFKSNDGSDNDELITSSIKKNYDKIDVGRNKISDLILDKAGELTPQFGIKLIDLKIRQIKYSDDLTNSVYNRMIKERNKIAQAFRSDGEGERAKWLGKMEKELRMIKSEAIRKAKEVKAKADASALEIRNKAYSQNPEFSEFWIAITKYQELLPGMNKTVTTDFDFFKYLYKKKK